MGFNTDNRIRLNIGSCSMKYALILRTRLPGSMSLVLMDFFTRQSMFLGCLRVWLESSAIWQAIGVLPCLQQGIWPWHMHFSFMHPVIAVEYAASFREMTIDSANFCIYLSAHILDVEQCEGENFGQNWRLALVVWKLALACGFMR